MTRRKLILALALLPALCFAADAPRGIHNFRQVDDHIYRGGQPSRDGIHDLAKLGVRAVVDLRGGGKRSVAEKKQVEALGMKYYAIPLPALDAPQKEEIAKVLGLLYDSQNWPVFVHCQHGRDRTGTVVACYRIGHDNWNNQRALKEAAYDGLSRFERGMRAFILQYRPPGETPKAVALAKPKSIQ
jgi:protein tyrosine/serine phosphatase